MEVTSVLTSLRHQMHFVIIKTTASRCFRCSGNYKVDEWWIMRIDSIIMGKFSAGSTWHWGPSVGLMTIMDLMVPWETSLKLPSLELLAVTKSLG